MSTLKGKVAIVTGASKGLGRAIAKRLAEAGATVIASARSEALLQELASQVPERIIPYHCDVTNSRQVQAMVQFTIEKYGKLDILINNAGLGHFAPLDELSEEQWDEMLNVNLKGVFLTCKYAIPYLKQT